MCSRAAATRLQGAKQSLQLPVYGLMANNDGLSATPAMGFRIPRARTRRANTFCQVRRPAPCGVWHRPSACGPFVDNLMTLSGLFGPAMDNNDDSGSRTGLHLQSLCGAQCRAYLYSGCRAMGHAKTSYTMHQAGEYGRVTDWWLYLAQYPHGCSEVVLPTRTSSPGSGLIKASGGIP